MFTSRKKITLIEDGLLNQVFDYCLNPNLTERERKIGLMAKKIWKRNAILSLSLINLCLVYNLRLCIQA